VKRGEGAKTSRLHPLLEGGVFALAGFGTRIAPLALTLALAASAAGCAGDYVARTGGVRRAYEAGDYARALQALDKEAKGPQIDKLLILLDKGMVLHAAGRLEESIKVLAEADKLSQELDLVSVSEEAATLLTSERERAYRGEDFEKLMISVLQALNYAQLGRDEDALVEVRRVNERIRKMIAEEKKPYEQLAIARYLGGVLYEDEGNEDSAFIDYYAAYQLQPELGPLAEPLLRLAKSTDRDDAYKELKARFPGLSDAPMGPGEGQVVVIVEAGLSPEKEPESRRHGQEGQIEVITVPVYRDRGNTGLATVTLEGKTQRAVPVTSLERVAKVHLEDRIGRLLLRQVAAAGVKAGIAAGAGAATKSEAVGVLAFLLLSALNQPDLRSWLSLPAEFQLARFRVPAGNHRVAITAQNQTTQHEVAVKPKRVTLLVVRRY
jgi:hypothetical protein